MSIESTLKAGAIVVRPGEKEEEVLLIFRARQQDWSFPKGHCEAGESFEATAFREVLEETGIEIRILKILPSMEYQNSKGLMHVEMFLASPKDDRQTIRLEREGDRVEWVPLSKISDRLTYRNLKEYFQAIAKDCVVL